MNGNAHPIALLDASLLKITRAGTLKPVPAPGTYAFGDVKTDHMLVIEYDPRSGWSAPEIKPYGPLELDPSSATFSLPPPTMPTRQSSSPSLVSSPPRTTDALLELTQQMTPSKPPEVLQRLRRDIQSQCLTPINQPLLSARARVKNAADRLNLLHERHSYYMQRLVEALANKKAWVLDLVAYWDRLLFPDADTPQSTSTGDQHLEDAEDDNSFFDSAPAMDSPARPVLYNFDQFVHQSPVRAVIRATTRPNRFSPNQNDTPNRSLPLRPSTSASSLVPRKSGGTQVYLGPDGKPRLFRPDQNVQRLLLSAARMGLPTFDPDALLACISKLIALEERWVPTEPGHSLYIRPTMIGTKPSIKVGPSDHAILYAVVTPVGPYFPTASPTDAGVSLLAVGEHVRSWPGGTGGFKLGLNYSPTFVPLQMAAKLGYDQVLWLLGDEQTVTEGTAMNFFAVIEREDGGLAVVTPPLDGTILPGITRDSALTLLRAHAAAPSPGILALPPTPALHVEERTIGMPELARAATAGRLLECFGIGTAVLVVAIERIGLVVDPKVQTIEDFEMRGGLKGLGPVGRALYHKLSAVKDGREQFNGWNVLCE
ncbi:aminotransferase [Mycena pura]|uniref:Branched-chain-amino-acid aminotransferase n=1 Tax=Mycena pura TaxID=153505 RepID=A0AAD6VDJ2_9AGAR|nr:aminotransferase [Mycena pura]